MHTRCPNCKTLFRITEAQLAMARGMVRCGFCKRVFNARSEDDAAAGEAAVETVDLRATRPEREQDIELDAFIANDGHATRPSLSDDPDESALYDSIDSGSGRRHSTAATVAWSLAILALIAALALEYAWFNQPQLLQNPGLKPLTAGLCEFADCEHMQKRDPAQIEMMSRNIYSHPNRKNALMISTALVNQADFAQPHPDVQIDFSNVRGELVASRRFIPEEYLQLDSEQIGLLQTGEQIAFALEIRDPGRDAITYEFSFH